MTTNKTTALIEAFRAEVSAIPMGQECVQKGASAYNWGKYYLARLEALAAFEQPDHIEQPLEMVERPAVREMTVMECMLGLETAYDAEIDNFGGKQYCAPSASKAMALALAKLGTIMVVES